MSKISKLFIPCLVLGSSLFAGNGCPGYTPQKKPKQKPKSECACKCEQMSHQRGPRREVTPKAGPCVSDGADLFATLDFIYWTAREEHLSFAATSGQTTASSSSSVSTGKVFDPDWKFKPGIKIGLGLNFDHDGWDLYANYTWYRSGDNTKTARPGTSTNLIDPFIGVNGTFQTTSSNGTTLSSAKGKWDLSHFDVIDLELGRNFYISRYLMLRPFAGLKGSWQKQKFDVTYNGIITRAQQTGGPTGATVFTSHNELKYWGLGLRGGLDTSWYFTRTFSLFGNLALSTMWDYFKSTRNDNQVTSGLNTSLINFSDNIHLIEPVIETEIGLRYEEWFCDDRYHFSVEAGWEFQWWSNMNQFDQLAMGARLGDLMLQGLTIHLRFDF